MGLTPAEKQKAYRARRKLMSQATAPLEPALAPSILRRTVAPASPPAPALAVVPKSLQSLVDLIDELYFARATYTTWRNRLRAALEE